MPAFLMYLEDWLDEAVLQGAVTLSEAWQVQDEILQTLEPVVQMPEELWPVMQKVQLSEAPPANSLPL